jgi:hypothetical protein
MKLKEGMLVEYFKDQRGWRVEKIIKVQGDTITVVSTLYNRLIEYRPGKCPRKNCPLVDKTHKHKYKGGKTRIKKDQVRKYSRYGKWREP